MLGEKSAMACTEAVETVIGEHYDEYVAHTFLYPANPLVNFFIWSRFARN